jgi:hypothetical protein
MLGYLMLLVIIPTILIAGNPTSKNNAIQYIKVYGICIHTRTISSYSPEDIIRHSKADSSNFSITDKYYCNLLNECLKDGQPCTQNKNQDVRIVLLLKRYNSSTLDTLSFSFSKYYNLNGISYKLSRKLIEVLTKRLPWDFLDGIEIITPRPNEQGECF